MEELQVKKAEEMRRYTLDYQIEILNSWYKNFFCIDKGCHTALFKKIIFFPEIVQELLEKGYDVTICNGANSKSSWSEISWLNSKEGRKGTLKKIKEETKGAC